MSISFPSAEFFRFRQQGLAADSTRSEHFEPNEAFKIHSSDRVPRCLLPRSIALLWCLATALIPPAAALADDVLLDTFEGEVVSTSPVSPDLGSYYGGNAGDCTVIDPGDGSRRLRCSDNSASGGFLFGFVPTDALDRAATEYVFRVESGATAGGGANDFDQQLILSPPGTNISIEWSAFIRQLGVRIFAAGGESQFFVQGFQWAYDTDYLVEIETDASTDQYTLSINGQLLVDDDLGADFTTLNRLSFRSGYPTLGSQQIDDVLIATLPEPGSALSAAVALVVIAWLGPRDRRGRS